MNAAEVLGIGQELRHTVIDEQASDDQCIGKRCSYCGRHAEGIALEQDQLGIESDDGIKYLIAAGVGAGANATES